MAAKDEDAATTAATSAWVGRLLGEYPDYPKPGILFYDVFPMFRQPAAVRATVAAFTAFARAHAGAVDVVVGLEARGFLLGPQLADALNVPFAPVRKPGKLPGAVARYAYRKEYGEDVVEMQRGAVAPGQRVLVVDDLLATGGTAAAAAALVAQLGATATAFCFVVELTALGGRAQLPPSSAIFALVPR